MQALISLRHTLHQFPETAFQEKKTAEQILRFFEPLAVDQVYHGLGGSGLAFVFKAKEKGKRLLFRSELDALPLESSGNQSYKSQHLGKAHLCGHDGHMAILCGLGRWLSEHKPKSGEVVLLFQPAEETGEGAQRVLEDPRFEQIRPDAAFALHNLPGFALHQVITRKGAFAAGSTGMTLHFTGKTAHAAHPEDGQNPSETISKLILALPDIRNAIPGFALATVIHIEIGRLAFGTSAGKGSLSLTLRAFDQENLEKLIQEVACKAKELAREARLQVEVVFQERFAVSKNDLEAAELAEEAFNTLELGVLEKPEPFRWSEDFGLFSQTCPSYLFGLGAGIDCPQLHEPDYDFPDELIETGVRIFKEIVESAQN